MSSATTTLRRIMHGRITRNSHNYVLVVDSAHQPKDVIHWQRAILGILCGSMVSLKNWQRNGEDILIHSVRSSIPKPCIVVLTQYHAQSYNLRVGASKYNIFLRDNYICQYTGTQLTDETANIDHVIPKSRGGRWTWDNLVTCDKKINALKDDKTPDEAKLKLIRLPKKPSKELLLRQKIKYSGIKEWIDFVNSK